MTLAAAFDLHPDELLYSALARHADAMRYPRGGAVLRAIRGRPGGTAVVDLPSGLDDVAARVVWVARPGRPALTGADLLREHTLWPYYRWSLPVARAARVEALMLGHGGAAVHNAIGLRACLVRAPARLRYCPDCDAEDVASLGSGYWRRVHQLPGVLVCPDHGCPLRDGVARSADARERRAFAAFRRTTAPPAPSQTLPATRGVQLVALARDARALLGPAPAGSAALSGIERRLLEEAGFVRPNGRVRLAALRHALASHFGPRLLRALGCRLSLLRGEGPTQDWLFRLVRKAGAPHPPLRHLLLLQFLGCDADDVGRLLVVAGALPPGEVCASDGGARDGNARGGAATRTVLPGFADPGTGEMRVGGVAGNATSDAAGVSDLGARTPDARPSKSARVSIPREALQRLIEDEAISLREMARRLAVTPKTVQRAARRLGLWRASWGTWDSSAAGDRRRRSSDSTRAKHRAAWRRVLGETPGASLMRLRRMLPSTYSYLYRFDREWMDAHRPSLRVAPSPRPRVDWPARDAALLDEAKAVVSELRRRGGRPARIYAATIARTLGKSAMLEQRAASLPSTTAYIRRAAEDGPSFARRKLRWAACQYEERQREDCQGDGQPVARWRLLRDAGISTRMATLLAAEIEDVLSRLARPRTPRHAA